MTNFSPSEMDLLVSRFRACLETLDREEGVEENVARDDVDLYSLLSEMAMLKNEVRLESRQYKGALEELREYGNMLREQNERLTLEIEKAREQTAKIQRQTEREFLLELLDLRDRMAAGIEATASRKPSLLARFLVSESRFLQSLEEGMSLTFRRMDDLLANHRVRPIDCVGLPVDPHTMRVVAVESMSGIPKGQVLKVVRRGFLHDGVLLRTAEVVVGGGRENAPTAAMGS